MEYVSVAITLAGATAMGLYNLRQVRRLLRDLRAMVRAHLARVERMQVTVGHGIASVQRSLDRIQQEPGGGGVAVAGPSRRSSGRAEACRQDARAMLWATSRSRTYGRRPAKTGDARRREG